MTYGRELLATRELLLNLTMREVKGQYRRTVLGQLWSIINPLATMLVYTVVFSILLRTQPPAGDPSGVDVYALWLMCGLLPWMFFTRVLNGGVASITSNAGLIKKVYFPRMHLPLSVTLATGITFSIELAVLSIALLFFGGMPLPWLPFVLIAMLILAMFAAGLAMMVAIVNVHFRDTQHFVSILLPMWMFLTPIIYPFALVEQAAARIGSWVSTVFELNPMLHIVQIFRTLLYDNALPDAFDWLVSIVAASIVFSLGYLVFARHERRLAELL
jgi:ABC-type polysaccharide/polyol phosphate export permease